MTAAPATSPPDLGLAAAVLPLVSLVALLIGFSLWLSLTPELLVAALLLAAGVAGGVAVRHGRTWDDIQTATAAKLSGVLPALLILLAIGLLIASWVVSGTIPYLVYWGVRLVRPELLLLTAFLATCAMSLFTGTSWGSAGTVGVALMGMAAALGVPAAATAGAVVSGAYFGDKMSPLSDSTNICAIGAGAPLWAHIRHMMYTALPSFVLALAVYGAMAGDMPAAELPASARLLLADLARVFDLGPLALVPPAIVAWSIARRVPPAIALALSSLAALGLGVVVQGFALQDALTAAVGGFRVAMVAPLGVEPAALGPAFRALVERGGLYSMATTLVVVLAAFLLAGAMEAAGALALLIRRLLAAVRSVLGLVAATMTAGLTTIALTSHGGVTALIVGGLFQGAYDERGLHRVNLSRSLEDSVTITEPLMPWTVSAVFMATTLGVPTIAYAPWAVFCWGGPIASLLLAAIYGKTGFGLRTTLPPIAPARNRRRATRGAAS